MYKIDYTVPIADKDYRYTIEIKCKNLKQLDNQTLIVDSVEIKTNFETISNIAKWNEDEKQWESILVNRF